MDGLRTWLEIDTGALRHNYQTFKKIVGPHPRVMAVVKSNAYGHGLTETAETLQDSGVNCFAVDSIVEATTLREHKIPGDILVLGHTLKERFRDASLADIMITVAGMADLENLQTDHSNYLFPYPLRVHVKIDTGMHRQGFSPSELPRVFEILKSLERKKDIAFDGLYTHLAAADDPDFYKETRSQIKRFLDAAREPLKWKLKPEYIHVVATAGALAYPEARYDMVRIGIGLYGYWPNPAEPKLFPPSALRPILSWKTVIADIKNLPREESIGYGFSEKLARDSRIALLPIGYWHGYRRALSGAAETLVHGKRAKVVGRVSMDMMSVDVTDIPEAKHGDVVTLIGGDGTDFVSAHELARLSGTTVYEVLTCINPRIRRICVVGQS